MIVQNTILITNFFRIESFGGRKKKNLLNRAAGNSAQQIQSYPSDMVRHYHYCKIAFLQQTYFELKVLVAGRVP